MKAEKLTEDAIGKSLTSLKNWTYSNQGIEKHFLFADFSEAFAFLTRVALLSEKINHHAEWSGVYNKVHLRLSTHDAGGVTVKDINMATEIDQF
ncbi:MAG: 4a-hydroxytetrahydrobiopterin dehydratase [Bacteroidetes bacterium]|nr:4a-hydroxytetrahydrobiopterin dehydratase [Bacteroidota bacterium]